jgi:adenylate kinase family enzyme
LGHQPNELGKAAEQWVEKGAHVLGGILGGIASMVGKVFDFLGDFIAPAPPSTKDQAERVERAAEEQQAVEKEARLQELLKQIRGDDAERERQAREDGGRGDDDDYDRRYERGGRGCGLSR